MIWIVAIAGGAIVFVVAEMVYLSVVLGWEDQKTRGLGYYGLPPERREAFKGVLRVHALLLLPVLRLMGALTKTTLDKTHFTYRGVPGPKGTCSEESFRRAHEYEPRPEDVFVATQMKCGTTWMQHVVYEVLNRGNGDLVDSGKTLYAVSPWLEALKGVSVEEAPLVGSERPSRVIKTHLPAPLCPDGAEARYIYVARHPISCFASCVDFVGTNLGAFAPGLDAVEAWFCSRELMWWGTWPDHVTGWWDRAQRRGNVLFVHFEEMKSDLPGVAARVAEFLGVAPLTSGELDRVTHKCGFQYMQHHEGAFEMHPPHILAIDAQMFVRGTADRHGDVPEDVRRRVAAWCAGEMEGSGYPLAEWYPNVMVGPMGG